ncbi:hypothetical protein XOCgx_3337 [Xanthomonas oryzae pv. oryzicola]|nr:hypothetical protein XOCgx_3337 [Xanthomonas oryzae pv. oryzicola]
MVLAAQRVEHGIGNGGFVFDDEHAGRRPGHAAQHNGMRARPTDQDVPRAA